MADNFLEKKFDEYASGKAPVRRSRNGAQPLDSLLLRNRSYRGYNKEHIVRLQDLKEIVAVNSKVPSAKNQQVLRFRLVTRDSGAEKLLAMTRWAGALPELHLPFKGTEPEAFIIICSTVTENKWVDVDLGISAQSMLLKATEMGLGGICIGAFNKEDVRREFELPYEPLLVLAIGKASETIQLKPVNAGDNLTYYRKDGVHYVPKIIAEDLII